MRKWLQKDAKLQKTNDKTLVKYNELRIYTLYEITTE